MIVGMPQAPSQSSLLINRKRGTILNNSLGELDRARGELQQLTASLINAQDDERRWVSRELHDDMSQKFAKIQMDVGTIARQLPPHFRDARRQLRRVGKEAASLSDDLRRLAHRLHPAILDVLGLTTALRTHVQDFSRHSGIGARFVSRRVPKDIPVEIAGCLYRITQEALRNVAKHAGDTSVEVLMRGTRSGLFLSIQDGGVGFDMYSARAQGLGLISMEERVRLVKGKFTLTTRPGKGVTIEIVVPLVRENAAPAC